jgi:hypothetical protein
MASPSREKEGPRCSTESAKAGLERFHGEVITTDLFVSPGLLDEFLKVVWGWG